MNYGSIAYINDGKLFIPEYLLRPFNIDNNTSLTILSYSTPTKDEQNKMELSKRLGYKNISPKLHDIIITPIPYRLWPFLIRAKIYLQNRPGAIASISNYFAAKGMNILSADCHRGGFRYMVYNCVLECTNVRQKYEIVNSKLRIKKEAKSKPINQEDWKELQKNIKDISDVLRNEMKPNEVNIEGYEKKFEEAVKEYLPEYDKEIRFTHGSNDNEMIKNQMKKFLFLATQDEKDEGMENQINPSSTLPHHYKTIELNVDGDKKDRTAHYSKYNNGSIKLPESYLGEMLLNHEIDLASKKEMPTFGFVNVDTHAPRIRVTLTPKFKINNFRRIIIDYRRDAKRQAGSIGFMAIVSHVLVGTYGLDLQNVVNRIWENRRKVETGKVEFIVSKYVNQNVDWKSVEQSLKKAILGSNNNFHHSKTIVKCTPINPYNFFISLKTSDNKFVENTKKVLYKAGEKFGIDKSAFKFVWTHSSPVTESVVQTLRECNALIQVYHSTNVKEDNFVWLDGEFLAMRALEKPCVRVCSDAKYFEDQFSQFDKDVMPYIINFAHGDKAMVRKYSNLLAELIGKIEENEPNALNRFV